MAHTPDITVRLRVDPRRMNAQLAHIAYNFGRIGHAFAHPPRTVDTRALVDARDLAYTRTDAAEGPAPWETA